MSKFVKELKEAYKKAVTSEETRKSEGAKNFYEEEVKAKAKKAASEGKHEVLVVIPKEVSEKHVYQLIRDDGLFYSMSPSPREPNVVRIKIFGWNEPVKMDDFDSILDEILNDFNKVKGQPPSYTDWPYIWSCKTFTSR